MTASTHARLDSQRPPAIRLLEAIRAGHGHLAGSDLARLIGVDPLDFWDLVARGIEAKRIRVNDEDRQNVRFEIVEAS